MGKRIVRRAQVGGWALAAVALSTVGLLHCSSSGAASEADSEAQAESEAVSSPGAVKPRKSVSFLVTSDLHFGYEAGVLRSGVVADDVDDVDDDEDDFTDEGDLATDDSGKTISILQKNQELAAALTLASSKGATSALAANGIDNGFQGVIVTGDIADNGKEDQWVDYHHTFDPPNFKIDMYETTGNHDYQWITPIKPPVTMAYSDGNAVYDIRKVNERSADRPHVIDVDGYDGGKEITDTTAEHSGSYAWVWRNPDDDKDSDVVFINLGVKASTHDDSKVKPRDGYARYTDPFHSLDFLKKVLGKVGKSHPIVLSFHYPLESSDYRMDQTERQELRDVIAGYPIAAILHGHRHRASLYTWCGVPVFEIDTPRNAGPGYDSSFAAVTIAEGTIAAQTISYRYQNDKPPQVSYDAVTSSTTSKDLNALCTGRTKDPHPCWYYPPHKLAAPVSKSCDVQQVITLP